MKLLRDKREGDNPQNSTVKMVHDHQPIQFCLL